MLPSQDQLLKAIGCNTWISLLIFFANPFNPAAMFEQRQKIVGSIAGTGGGVINFWIAKVPTFQDKIIESVIIAVICAITSAFCVDLYKGVKKWASRKFLR